MTRATHRTIAIVGVAVVFGSCLGVRAGRVETTAARGLLLPPASPEMGCIPENEICDIGPGIIVKDREGVEQWADVVCHRWKVASRD